MQASPALTGLLVGGAVSVLLVRRRSDRLERVVPNRAAPPGRAAVPQPRAFAGRRRPLGACLLAAGAVLLLLPAIVALPLALGLVLAGPRALGRLEPAAARDRRERLRSDLPMVLDLLGACLAGGASLLPAAAAVADAVGGPAGERLDRVATALAVGSPAVEAWLQLAGPDPDGDPLGAAARTLARTADGGAAVAAVLVRLADDARADARAAGQQAARRVGVLAVAPLGLCFLPAFVLLGVVPVVAGLAAPLFASG